MPIYRRCGRCGTRYETGQKCPRCADLVTQDNRLRYRQYDKYKRDRDAKKFHDSDEWKITRAYILSMDELDVYEYMTTGRMIPADTVHHIIPYRDDNTKAGTEQGENLSKFFFGFSLALLAINIIAIIVKYRGTKKDKERSEKISKENFMTVQAKYVETIINSDVTVFGTHPYNIICEWKNPVDKKRYRFVSEDLWRSPQRKILEKSILSFEVNFDKTDVNNYKIIIPEILK